MQIDVTTETTVPAIPAARADNYLEAINAVKELLEVREGLRGDPLDQVVTFRDLYRAGKLDLSSINGNAMVRLPGGDLQFLPVSPDLSSDFTPPPAPKNVTASGALTTVIIEFDDPGYHNHSIAEIWRSGTNNIGTAVKIGTTLGPATLYADAVGITGVTRYYWVRFVSTAGVVGPFQGTSGVAATLGFVTTTDLTDLLITATKIADGAVTTVKISDAAVGLAKFAANLRPVQIVTSLPTLPDATYPEGATAYLTTDDMLYRSTGTTWTAAVPTSVLTGTIGTAQIADAAVTTVKVATAAITTALIAAAAVTTTEISDNAITTPKIVTGAITTVKIAADAVTANEILAGSVTTAKIATGAVTTNELAAVSVTTAKLAAGAVTATELAANSVIAGKIAAGVVSATELAAAAVVAGKIAAGAIVAGDGAIANLAIATAQIQDGAIVNAKIGSLAVDTAKIADAAIVTAKIADANITTVKIADANITEAKIGSLAVTVAKIGALAVTTAKIDDLAVTALKIGALAVTTAKIDDLAVTTAKIADANITTAKIATANITTALIADANITGAKIASATITSANIASATIALANINTATITSLAALSADLGAITAGTIVLSSSGYIRSGQTAYNTGAGFWLGIDSGTPKFSIGDASSHYMTWDGSELSVSGNVNPYTPGSALLISSDASKGFTDTTYAKQKEIVVARAGTLTVEFTLAMNGSGYTASIFGRIYRNGSAVGTERQLNAVSVTGATQNTYSEDIAVSRGDTVELWGKRSTTSGTVTFGVSNYRLKTGSPVVEQVTLA